MNLTPYDFSLIVFLAAAAIGHHRVSQEKPDHAGVARAIVGAVLANLGHLALYPNRGLIPVILLLAVPGACLYGITSTHGFRSWIAIGFVMFLACATWIVGLIYPWAYAWTVLFSWCVIAGLAWVCLLDPEKRAIGITRASAVALAASLLADLPGVYAWVKTESWKAESVLTSLSVLILATLPALWKARIFERSLLGSFYWRSESGSAEGREIKIQKRSE
jgi:hypothetical protein